MREYDTPQVFPPGSVTPTEYYLLIDFEIPRPISDSGSAADAIVRRVPSFALSGSYALQLYTAEPEVNDTVVNITPFGMRGSPAIETECQFFLDSPLQDLQFDYILKISALKTLYRSYAAVRIDTTDLKVYVQIGATDWKRVATLKGLAKGHWNHISLEIDKLKQTYKRLVINQEEIAVKDISYYVSDTVDAANDIEWLLRALSTDPTEIGIDNNIIKFLPS